MSQANAQIQSIGAAGFNQLSQMRRVPLGSAQSWADNTQLKFELPRVGLGYQLWVTVQLTVVVAGTVSGGTFASFPNPAPYSAFKKVRFGNNNSVYMRDHSGWGGALHNRYRYGIDPFVHGSTSKFAANAQTVLGLTGTRPFPGGTVAAGTYTMNFSYPIPLSYNFSNETSLLVLQNQSIFNLLIDTGALSANIGATGGTNDLFNGLTGTGLSVTVSGSVSATLEYMLSLDPSKFDYSSLYSMFMAVNEQIFSLVNGAQVIAPPVNDWYTMLLLELSTNGAAVADSALSNLTLSHSGGVNVSIEDRISQITRSYYMHEGVPPMDGVIDYDFGLRAGNIHKRDTLDALNDQNITDLRVGFTTTGLTLTNAQTRFVGESLKRVG